MILPKSAAIVVVIAFMAAAVLASAAPAQQPVAAAQPCPPGFQSIMPDEQLRGWQGAFANPTTVHRIGRLRMNRLQRLADADMLVHWDVQNGILRHDGRGKNIATVCEFRNFELLLEYQLTPGADTGVFLRGAPQVQIWDATAGRAGEGIGSGGLHHNRRHPSKPTALADRPPGEWNELLIRMQDDAVTVVLNGVTVTDRVPLENHWAPGERLPASGPIELQGGGGAVSFRNICLRGLPDE